MSGLAARRRTRRLVRVTACVLASLGLASASVVRAEAQEGPIPAPPVPGQVLQSWALAPTGDDPAQPSTRPFLSYSLDPGASATDSVSLWNYSDVQLNFRIYATDAFNNADGEFSLLPGDEPAKDAGGWVTPAVSNVTVEARTRVDIPITVQVPPGAAPGDHVAGIVASLPTGTIGPNGSRAIVDRRTGSRVYVRVPGKVNQALTVEDLSASYDGTLNPADGSADVTYTLRNVGNVRLGTRQTVELTDIFGRTLATHTGKFVQELLPGSALRLRAHFDGIPALVRLGASVRLRPVAPVGVTEKPPATTEFTDHFWAIPWTVLLVLLLGIVGWRIVRRIRRSRGRSASPQSSPGGPVGPGGQNGGRGVGDGVAGDVPVPTRRQGTTDWRPGTA